MPLWEDVCGGAQFGCAPVEDLCAQANRVGVGGAQTKCAPVECKVSSNTLVMRAVSGGAFVVCNVWVEQSADGGCVPVLPVFPVEDQSYIVEDLRCTRKESL